MSAALSRRRAGAPGDGLARVAELVRKEFRQILRNPRMRTFLLGPPIGQLLIFGYAVSTDVHHTRLFVVDQDQTSASRAVVDALTASGVFRVVGRSERPGDLVDVLDHGRAVAAIEIPPGFGRRLGEGAGAEAQLLFDGTNSNQALVARGYAERILRSYGARLGPLSSSGAAPAAAAIDLRERAWFNPSLESRDYNVPGVVGMIILLVCFLLTSLAVVRERELGTLEQLMVSPLRPFELMAGKTIPFALIGLVDLALITTVALAWFHVPFRGSPLLLLLGSVIFLIPVLGLGLLVSTISATQQEAFLTTFLVIMPTMLLSGFMFPVRSMPPLFQWLTLLNPLRHYLEIVRAIFLKGAGLDALWPQFLALLVMAAGILPFAARRFHKTVS